MLIRLSYRVNIFFGENVGTHLTLFGKPLEHITRHSGYVAINVKVYSGLLSPELRKRLDKHSPTTQRALCNLAEESVRQQWWAWASEYAKTLGLGPIHSAGRSGGWLTLNTRFGSLESDIDVLEERLDCVNCGTPYTSHLVDQCLFDTSTFAPGEDWTLERIQKLVSYAEAIHTSLAQTVSDFEDMLIRKLDEGDICGYADDDVF